MRVCMSGPPTSFVPPTANGFLGVTTIGSSSRHNATWLASERTRETRSPARRPSCRLCVNAIDSALPDSHSKTKPIQVSRTGWTFLRSLAEPTSAGFQKVRKELFLDSGVG